MTHDLESVALTLVADGKGILAADETFSTLTKRFDTLGIQSTEKSRRTYRLGRIFRALRGMGARARLNDFCKGGKRLAAYGARKAWLVECNLGPRPPDPDK